MAVKKYLDYEGLQEFYSKLKNKYGQALQYKGTVQNVAALDLANAVAGYMYSIEEEGISTSDFIEGPGKVVRAGANVAAVNVAAEGAPEVLKWDILPGVFSLDDRLQFGPEMPEDPEDGQTFLYMGETTYAYTDVSSTLNPGDDPSTEGWFTYDSLNDIYSPSVDTHVDTTKVYMTVVGDDSVQPSVNPKEEGYYELISGEYVKTTDETVESKTYYLVTANAVTADPGDDPSAMGLYEFDGVDTYTLTADTYVHDSKGYYTRAEQYVTGVIYVYDDSQSKWIPQTAGDTFVRITEVEIDSLFT